MHITSFVVKGVITEFGWRVRDLLHHFLFKCHVSIIVANATKKGLLQDMNVCLIALIVRPESNAIL